MSESTFVEMLQCWKSYVTAQSCSDGRSASGEHLISVCTDLKTGLGC